MVYATLHDLTEVSKRRWHHGHAKAAVVGKWALGIAALLVLTTIMTGINVVANVDDGSDPTIPAEFGVLEDMKQEFLMYLRAERRQRSLVELCEAVSSHVTAGATPLTKYEPSVRELQMAAAQYGCIDALRTLPQPTHGEAGQDDAHDASDLVLAASNCYYEHILDDVPGVNCDAVFIDILLPAGLVTPDTLAVAGADGMTSIVGLSMVGTPTVIEKLAQETILTAPLIDFSPDAQASPLVWAALAVSRGVDGDVAEGVRRFKLFVDVAAAAYKEPKNLAEDAQPAEDERIPVKAQVAAEARALLYRSLGIDVDEDATAADADRAAELGYDPVGPISKQAANILFAVVEACATTMQSDDADTSWVGDVMDIIFESFQDSVVADLLHTRSSHGDGVMHRALGHGCASVVVKLAENNLLTRDLLNMPDADGDTPIMVTVLRQDYEMLALIPHAAAPGWGRHGSNG